jgi:hypothetical protein
MTGIELCKFTHGLGLYIRKSKNIKAQPMCKFAQLSMKNLQSVTVLTEIVPFRLFHFSVSPLNSLIFWFLNVLILRVSRLHKLSKLPYTTINFTVISKIRFFLQLTLFLLSRAMHKLLTYFSVLKPCEMTTFYRENI